MNCKSQFLLIFVFMATMISCKNQEAPAKTTIVNLIPKPVSVTATNDVFTLTGETGIYVQSQLAEDLRIGQWLADKLKPATGFNIKVSSSSETPEAGNIYLMYSANDSALGKEGYELTITKDMIKIAANKPAGWFYAMQTIRQLLPAKAELSSVQQGPWEMATGTVRDYPEYVYRGSMLDVARHFFGVDDVKRYIDLIAAYKMNVLHLHLSDDQGWRIEIKSWPNLTTIGGSTQVGGGKGGFYTQEQYKEIVKYAQERFITIVPEIDMPGHTNAALASYKELHSSGVTASSLQAGSERSGKDTAINLYTGIEVGFSSLRTHKAVTYTFVDDVMRELAEITPGPWIHIGGDESHSTSKADYIPFVSRVQEMVIAHGKQVIGWDEIALSTIQPNTVAQFWADAENSRQAVVKGAKIIMSPAKKAYLDMQYDSTTKLGLHWAAYIEVDSAYIWDPANYTDGITRKDILGVEAALWSETITHMEDIEYMAFPRLPGYAEIGWSPVAGRNWDEYKLRLGNHGSRFNAMGINYYKSKLVPWVE